MKIAVTASGEGLDAPASPVFGRCQYVVLVETENLANESLPNPAISAAGGAGIQAAQFLTGHGIEALVTGNVGPNAYQVLDAAQIPVYLYDGPSVRQAVQAYLDGKLDKASGPSAPSHSGVGDPARGRRGQGRRS